MKQHQLAKYRVEWAKAAEVLSKSGMSAEDLEEERLAILRSVGVKSSKDFTEAQLTRALGACRAIYAPDLDDQIATEEIANAQDNPTSRLLFRIRRALDVISPQDRNAYQAHVATQCGCPTDLKHASWGQLRSLCGCLERTARSKK